MSIHFFFQFQMDYGYHTRLKTFCFAKVAKVQWVKVIVESQWIKRDTGFHQIKVWGKGEIITQSCRVSLFQ